MRNQLTILFAASLAASAAAQDSEAHSEGMFPVPDYSGEGLERTNLTGDWGGSRQDLADKGVTFGLDWYQAYQDVVSGGRREGSQASTNLDYRVTLDLMRMDVMPGAILSVRAQSRWGDTVNADSGVLLPVNTYSGFPFSSDPDGEVDLALTEFNWTQFLSEDFGVVFGKITTLKTANEFMGGEGRTQFMNFQFMFSPVVAQLAPYSTLAVGALWIPNPTWTVTTTFMNLTDASTSSGFDDIGDGTTWGTVADYKGSLNSLPGGGSLGAYYSFGAEFGKIGGLNFAPGNGINVDTKSESWALTWSGWQYLTAEEDSGTLDPRNGRQDLQGIGLFAQVGFADEDTNPVSWSISGGLSGRGSIPSRDNDVWGAGYFYNDVQALGAGPLVFGNSVSGFEAYYDIALAGSVSFALDAQWMQGAFPNVKDSTILGARLNVSF